MKGTVEEGAVFKILHIIAFDWAYSACSDIVL
jgi:hypothetical protein